MVIFYSYVKLPEGIWKRTKEKWQVKFCHNLAKIRQHSATRIKQNPGFSQCFFSIGESCAHQMNPNDKMSNSCNPNSAS